MQAAHALVELVRRRPESAQRWNDETNVLIVLEADRQEMFEAFREVFYEGGFPVWFFEPDFDDSATAFAVFNDAEGFVSDALSGLSLAQRKPAGRFTEWRRRKAETKLRGHAAGTVR